MNILMNETLRQNACLGRLVLWDNHAHEEEQIDPVLGAYTKSGESGSWPPGLHNPAWAAAPPRCM